MPERHFDVIVIGGGPAGEVCAGDLATGGLHVALVESHLVGGQCSYYACMPSKALLRAPEVLAEAARIPGAAEAVTGTVDADAVLRRRDDVIHDLSDDVQLPWLEERDVELVRGHAQLDGERRVHVGGDVLVADRAVVVAVGTGAAMPPIEALADARPWTNREATTASSVPGRLLVLGGGGVGTELAQAWAQLGSKVTLVELFDRILVREEPFASAEVEAALVELGVDVRTSSEAVAVSSRDGEVTLELAGGSSVTGDELLVAVGRRPLTDDLGVETIGLEPGASIDVDDTMRSTAADWLYGIGDVNGRSLLTHMGKYQGRIAAQNILGNELRVATAAHGPRAPRVVFTNPQVAAVGHTDESARKAGIRTTVVEHPTAGTAGASFYGRNATGTTRFVFDAEREVLVGATFVGPEVAELLHAATIAVTAEIPVDLLAHAVPPFPTRSEVWLRILEQYTADRQQEAARAQAS